MRFGGGLGNSLRLEIGSSETADENEMTAKSECRDSGAPLPPVILSLTRDVKCSSSGGTMVAMMQTTQS